jgi:hypothetical protein
LESQVAPRSLSFRPVVTAELGEGFDSANFGRDFVHRYLSYAHSNGLSYQAWVWDVWGRYSTLIHDYQGTPTAFGDAYRKHLMSTQRFADMPLHGANAVEAVIRNSA